MIDVIVVVVVCVISGLLYWLEWNRICIHTSSRHGWPLLLLLIVCEVESTFAISLLRETTSLQCQSISCIVIIIVLLGQAGLLLFLPTRDKERSFLLLIIAYHSSDL